MGPGDAGVQGDASCPIVASTPVAASFEPGPPPSGGEPSATVPDPSAVAPVSAAGGWPVPTSPLASTPPPLEPTAPPPSPRRGGERVASSWMGPHATAQIGAQCAAIFQIARIDAP